MARHAGRDVVRVVGIEYPGNPVAGCQHQIEQRSEHPDQALHAPPEHDIGA